MCFLHFLCIQNFICSANRRGGKSEGAIGAGLLFSLHLSSSWCFLEQYEHLYTARRNKIFTIVISNIFWLLDRATILLSLKNTLNALQKLAQQGRARLIVSSTWQLVLLPSPEDHNFCPQKSNQFSRSRVSCLSKLSNKAMESISTICRVSRVSMHSCCFCRCCRNHIAIGRRLQRLWGFPSPRPPVLARWSLWPDDECSRELVYSYDCPFMTDTWIWNAENPLYKECGLSNFEER